MAEPMLTPLAEAKDSLARLLRAYRQQAKPLWNGQDGNMDTRAINRCMTLDTIGQLRRRVRRLSGR